MNELGHRREKGKGGAPFRSTSPRVRNDFFTSDVENLVEKPVEERRFSASSGAFDRFAPIMVHRGDGRTPPEAGQL
jgi:hypothetical protein